MAHWRCQREEEERADDLLLASVCGSRLGTSAGWLPVQPNLLLLES